MEKSDRVCAENQYSLRCKCQSYDRLSTSVTGDTVSCWGNVVTALHGCQQAWFSLNQPRGVSPRVFLVHRECLKLTTSSSMLTSKTATHKPRANYHPPTAKLNSQNINVWYSNHYLIFDTTFITVFGHRNRFSLIQMG